jgi:hypothetical protein
MRAAIVCVCGSAAALAHRALHRARSAVSDVRQLDRCPVVSRHRLVVISAALTDQRRCSQFYSTDSGIMGCEVRHNRAPCREPRRQCKRPTTTRVYALAAPCFRFAARRPFSRSRCRLFPSTQTTCRHGVRPWRVLVYEAAGAQSRELSQWQAFERRGCCQLLSADAFVDLVESGDEYGGQSRVATVFVRAVSDLGANHQTFGCLGLIHASREFSGS